MISHKDLSLFHSMTQQVEGEGATRLRQYMLGRGVTPDQLQTFQIGYTDPSMRGELEGRISPVFLRWLEKNHILDHKMVFPIHDPLQRLAGLQTRGLEKKTFHKIYAAGSEALPTFLGLVQALDAFKDQRVLYLTEGIFDFFALQRMVPNVVCVTTASISQAQLRFLSRFCQEVIVAFDMDSVGDKGYKTVEKHLSGTSIKVERLEYPYKDLSEFLERDGFEAFRDYFQPMLELRTLLDDLTFRLSI